MTLRNYLLIFLILITREINPINRGISMVLKPMATTLADLDLFLDVDQTDQRIYTQDHNCVSFSCDLVRRAFEYGISSNIVLLFTDTLPGHSVVKFSTQDAGDIYIEPQTDEIFDLAGISRIVPAYCLGLDKHD